MPGHVVVHHTPNGIANEEVTCNHDIALPLLMLTSYQTASTSSHQVHEPCWPWDGMQTDLLHRVGAGAALAFRMYRY
jgi:hypothetical protein